MLSDLEFDNWHRGLGLPEAAIEIINRVRKSPPFRVVQGRHGNVRGRYASHKMGQTIQFESHSVELPFAHLLERDNDVLEYYDQPSEQVKLQYKAGKNEKVVGFYQTADFFVIEKEEAGWMECKTEEELIKLSEESPNRYVKIDGQWHCPPGEAYAEQYGLHYWVRSSAELNQVYLRNCNFLEDYYLEGRIDVPDEVKEKVVSLVSANVGILLKDLIDRSHVEADDIYRLLVQEEIYVNLELELLSETHRCHVYKNPQVALSHQTIISTKKDIAIKNCVADIKVGNDIRWNGNIWTIVNLSEKYISVNSREGGITDIKRDQFVKLIFDGHIKNADNEPIKIIKQQVNEQLARASVADITEAIRRYDIIQPYLEGEKTLREGDDLSVGVTPKTIRNWIQSYLEAERIYGVGFIGLLPNTKRKGNRTPRISEAVIAAFNAFMDENETPTNQSKIVLYGKFLRKCETLGLIPPSAKTFYKMVDKRPDRLRKTQGSRAAYNAEPFFYESLSPQRHGERAFDVAHIDHTEAGEELVHSITGKNLRKPNLTLLIDAYSRRVLAFYLSFHKPSIVSDMMVIRECVRRYGRLPQTIVSDNGADFMSVYYQKLLACFGTTLKYRSPHRSRQGAVIERLFGTVTTQVFNNLRGNTKVMLNVRQVTKMVNPKLRAVWTLPLLYSLLEKYFYEFYDTREHSALGESPKEAFERSMRYSGNRPARYISYDEDFMMMTMPFLGRNKGKAKVDFRCGVKVNYFYYNSPELLGLGKDEVEVRVDPWNIGVVYCDGIPCYSEFYQILKGMSIEEVRIASEELWQQKRLYYKNKDDFARELAEFISGAEQTEKMQLMREYMEEMKPQLSVINGGLMDPAKDFAVTSLDEETDDKDIDMFFDIDDEG